MYVYYNQVVQVLTRLRPETNLAEERAAKKRRLTQDVTTPFGSQKSSDFSDALADMKQRMANVTGTCLNASLGRTCS
jgi:hypothetical protein